MKKILLCDGDSWTAGDIVDPKIFGDRKWKSYEEEQLLKMDKASTKKKVSDTKKENATPENDSSEKDNGEKLD